jgi:hypothetical protein
VSEAPATQLLPPLAAPPPPPPPAADAADAEEPQQVDAPPVFAPIVPPPDRPYAAASEFYAVALPPWLCEAAAESAHRAPVDTAAALMGSPWEMAMRMHDS